MNNAETVERIRTLCKQKGTSLTKVEAALGFSNGYIGSLAKRPSAPPVDRLKAIADFLAVPLEYLMDGTETESEPIQTTSKPCPNDTVENLRDALLPEDEKELLDLYRQMSEAGRAKLMDYANLLLMADVNKKFTVQEVSA